MFDKILPEILATLTGAGIIGLFSHMYHNGSWSKQRRLATHYEHEGDKYAERELWNKAIERYESSLAILEKDMKMDRVAVLSKKLAKVYLSSGDQDLALAYCIKCESIWDDLKKGIKIYEVHEDLARIFIKRGDFSTAQKYALKALEEQKRIHSPSLPVSLTLMGCIAKERGAFDEAEA